MKYQELNQQFEQVGKQFGDRLIYRLSDGAREILHGYKITSFSGFDPDRVEIVKVISVEKEDLSSNSAYNLLFGAPSERPNLIN